MKKKNSKNKKPLMKDFANPSKKFWGIKSKKSFFQTEFKILHAS